MHKVAIAYHKDGDLLIVESAPWWGDAFEWLTFKLFCPCCGISGWLANKWEWYSLKAHAVSGKVVGITYRRTKELYAVPIKSGCEARKAIFGEHDICWREECELSEPS